MKSKAIVGSFLLILTGSCFAGVAVDMAEEQARFLASVLPMQYGEGVLLVGAKSRGSKILLDVKIDAIRKNISKGDLEAYLQANRDSQCADPTSRNFMAQGVSYEIKLIWKDNATSFVAVDSRICGIKKGEVTTESGDSVKAIVDSGQSLLPMKIDEITTLVSPRVRIVVASI